MTRRTLIDSNPDEYNQRLHYYPFMVNLDRCNESCNTLDDPPGRICGINTFTMITRVNESNSLTKCNSNQKWNNNKCRCQCKIRKNAMCANCIWNPGTCTCKNGKYLESIIGDPVAICDEIMEVTITVPAKTFSRRVEDLRW